MLFERIVFIKETESLSLTWKQSNIENHMTQHRNKYPPEDIYQLSIKTSCWEWAQNELN